jgi:hypothetical protein
MRKKLEIVNAYAYVRSSVRRKNVRITKSLRQHEGGEWHGPWVCYHGNGTVNDELTGTFRNGVKVE